MNTYIDESGTFVSPAPLGSWNIVAALVTPEHTKRHLVQILEKLKSEACVPRHNEVKLAALTERTYIEFLTGLRKLDLLLFAVATDCGLADSLVVQNHQAVQVAKIKENLPKMIYEGGRQGVEDLAVAVERLSPQLYTQLVCQTELIHDVLLRGLLYYVQRTPQALRELRWRIDEKNAARPSFERTFKWIAPGLLQSKSIRDPLLQVYEFDYRHFQHYEHSTETMPTHLELPNGDKITSGLDLRRMLNGNLKFVDSKAEAGVQVIDLLAGGLRRLLRGQFSDNRAIAKLLGSMMVGNKRDQIAIKLISLGSPATIGLPTSDIIRVLDRASKGMFRNAA